MKPTARTLAATAAGVAVIVLGLMALAAAQLWRRWDRWKTRRLLGRVLKHREQHQQALCERFWRDAGRKGA